MSPALRKREHSLGVALTVTSAVTFGATGDLAKDAYAAGVGVSSLLGARFALAAALLWIVVAIRRPALPPLRLVVAALALGAVGFAGEATLYFSALERLDASLVVLLLTTYPAIVVLVAIAARPRAAGPAARRRARRLGHRRGARALGGAQVTGSTASAWRSPPRAVVAVRELHAPGRSRGTPRRRHAARDARRHRARRLRHALHGRCLGFARLRPRQDAWVAIGVMATLCTIVPIATFLLALPRVGSPVRRDHLDASSRRHRRPRRGRCSASTLGAAQLAGGALVMGATLLLQLSRRRG